MNTDYLSERRRIHPRLFGQQVVAHHLRLIWQQPVAKLLLTENETHTTGEVPAF